MYYLMNRTRSFFTVRRWNRCPRTSLGSCPVRRKRSRIICRSDHRPNRCDPTAPMLLEGWCGLQCLEATDGEFRNALEQFGFVLPPERDQFRDQTLGGSSEALGRRGGKSGVSQGGQGASRGAGAGVSSGETSTIRESESRFDPAFAHGAQSLH